MKLQSCHACSATFQWPGGMRIILVCLIFDVSVQVNVKYGCLALVLNSWRNWNAVQMSKEDRKACLTNRLLDVNYIVREHKALPRCCADVRGGGEGVLNWHFAPTSLYCSSRQGIPKIASTCRRRNGRGFGLTVYSVSLYSWSRQGQYFEGWGGWAEQRCE